MKNIKFGIVLVLSILVLGNSIFATGFDTSGDLYRYKQDGEYVFDAIVYDKMEYYYIDENGFLVKNNWIEYDKNWYYATNTGKLYRNGKYLIDGKTYFFDNEGKMLTGWIEDIYYANEDGYLITGFQELTIPKTWIMDEEEIEEVSGWFYFGADFKKVSAVDEPYIVKLIGDSRYCFDANGVMCTGWRQIKETEPIMKGYMYFTDIETDDFKYGEAVCNSWYAIDPPEEVLPNSDVKYFYFNATGYLKTADQGKYTKVKVNTKTYLFNEYGYTVYGIKKVDGEYYYFGNNEADCSMRTGRYTLNDGYGNSVEYYFDQGGIGYTGVYMNKLYNKGLLLKADEHSKYVAYKVDGYDRLVNTAGTIMKNKRKIKDGNGVLWTTNGSGVVIDTDEGEILIPDEPTVTED